MERYELVQLPEDENSMILPRYPLSVFQLLKWDKWSSLGWIRIFYLVSVVFICIVGFLVFVSGFFGGVWGILISIFIVPFIILIWLAGLRVITEVMLAVLIIPHQLFRNFKELKDTKLLIQSQQQPAEVQLQLQSVQVIPEQQTSSNLQTYNMQHINPMSNVSVNSNENHAIAVAPPATNFNGQENGEVLFRYTGNGK